jgi:hypothetical protein
MPFGSTVQKLFELRSANMAITTDQVFTRLFSGTNYVITDIVGIRVTGAFGVACLGGIYNAVDKPAGGIFVAAAQSWVNMTGAGKIVRPALAALIALATATDVQTLTPYFSLSTGNTGALTARISIYGLPLD